LKAAPPKKAAAKPARINATTSIVSEGPLPTVDPECIIAHKAHVYNDGCQIWSTTLNLTNIKPNSDKYCLIQVLETNDLQEYYTWITQGVVGKPG
jgi:hypothetical protein